MLVNIRWRVIIENVFSATKSPKFTWPILVATIYIILYQNSIPVMLLVAGNRKRWRSDARGIVALVCFNSTSLILHY